jgi:hypothetical protein
LSILASQNFSSYRILRGTTSTGSGQIGFALLVLLVSLIILHRSADMRQRACSYLIATGFAAHTGLLNS